MNTHTTIHLDGPEVVEPGGHGVEALVIEGTSSTVGIFVGRMPVAERLRFLAALADEALALRAQINMRDRSAS